jgi:hypothetical protein
MLCGAISGTSGASFKLEYFAFFVVSSLTFSVHQYHYWFATHCFHLNTLVLLTLSVTLTRTKKYPQQIKQH